MEHKWDEGFGYLYGLEGDNLSTAGSSPSGNGSLLMKYFKKVNDEGGYEPGIGEVVYDAFIMGRTAIVNKNYEYFPYEQDKDFYINSMKKYVETKQGLDQKLEELITPIIQNNNFKIYGTSLNATQNYNSIRYNSSTALIAGSENNGISDFWIKNSDILIKIPMLGMADSLNVSVSSGICLSEINRQNKFNR